MRYTVTNLLTFPLKSTNLQHIVYVGNVIDSETGINCIFASSYENDKCDADTEIRTYGFAGHDHDSDFQQIVREMPAADGYYYFSIYSEKDALDIFKPVDFFKKSISEIVEELKKELL